MSPIGKPKAPVLEKDDEDTLGYTLYRRYNGIADPAVDDCGHILLLLSQFEIDSLSFLQKDEQIQSLFVQFLKESHSPWYQYPTPLHQRCHQFLQFPKDDETYFLVNVELSMQRRFACPLYFPRQKPHQLLWHQNH